MRFGKFKKSYDFIMSIGQGCVAPQLLKEKNLRVKSGPFDWTFVNNYKISIDILKNKFESYFSKDDLEFLGFDDFSRTDIYGNKQRTIKYVHAIVPSSRMPFEEAYILAEQKYRRRIDRLFNYISSDAKICLLYIERAPDWESPEEYLKQTQITNKILEDDIKELNNIYGHKCFDIFYIKHDETIPMNKYKIDRRICYMNNSAADWRAPFRGNFEVLGEIITQKMQLSLKVKLEQIKNKIKTTKLILKLIYT